MNTRFFQLFFFLLLSVSCMCLEADSIKFFVEIPQTEEEQEWGLMQRRTLPENQGMLFHYPQPVIPIFWSFNCFIDMSVAFMDEKMKIVEIKCLFAFPEKMDPKRPVFSLRDFKLYPENDPIVVFFRKNSVSPSIPINYALEMNLGWFKKNGVKVGDVLHLDPITQWAFFKAQ